MADVTDIASEREERMKRDALRNVANVALLKKRERLCRKCGEVNDRYHEGYVVCSDCMVPQPPGAA